MQIIIQNESIGYSLNQVLNVSEERGERWIRKGYARAFEAPVEEPKKEESKPKSKAKKTDNKRVK